MTASFEDPTRPSEAAPLVQALRVVRERWWIVLATTLAFTALALGLALTAEDQYQASASLLFGQDKLTRILDPGAANNEDPAREQGTNLLLVKSTAVAERVRVKLRLPRDTDLLETIDASSEPDANLINLTATDRDPRRAADLANAFADEFIAYRTLRDQQRILTAERSLRQRRDGLPLNDLAGRQQADQQLNTFRSLRALVGGDAEVVDRASPPAEPSAPRPKRDAVLGLLLGLVLGTALAFLIDLFDRRVKGVEDMEELYGIRALATVPNRSRDPTTQKERQVALEPFRILRNGLGFLAVGSPIKVVMVTSAMPGEGKSTIAAGLARATALAGQHVVLVEADLRRPTFQDQFDLGGDSRGLTTALVGGVRASELLRNVLPGLHTLSVLPSGPLPPNSAELLRSAEMGQLLRDLADQADLVILDAPPLLPVADAQVLLDHPQVDACLVVARAFKTTRDDVRRTRAVLERHRLRNLGLVVNGLRETETNYEYYGSTDGSGGAVRLGAVT